MLKINYNSFILFKIAFLCLGVLLVGCSSSEEKERKQLRKENLQGEYIYRRHDELLFALDEPQLKKPDPYPWEKQSASKHPYITKDFFRCKGSMSHPVKVVQKEKEQIRYNDCGGGDKHSLPLKGDKEFIYPILIDLLNYLQSATGKKVVITCGHRCPDHQQYVDPTSYNKGVKHMIGAQVSFYVQGMENRPDAVVDLLMAFYKKDARYQGDADYVEFKRESKPEGDVSTPPWTNKEIFIKLYKSGEGRDFDQRHPYSYISVQVKFDRDLNEKVTYSWERARQYHRW